MTDREFDEAITYLKTLDMIVEKKYLVLSDFDDTIQPHSDVSYDKTVKIMLELQNHGFSCGIITGRPGNNFKAKCKELNLWQYYKQLDFIITDNGNSAYIPKTAKDYINVGISSEVAISAIKYAKKKSIPAILNTDRGIYAMGIDTSDFSPLNRLLYKEIEEFEISKFDGKFIQINLGEPISESTLELDNDTIITSWDDNFYALSIKGGKANAYNAIIKNNNYEKFYAFGDQVNDIDMFEIDQVYGICVANASEKLKVYADRISNYSVTDDCVGRELIHEIQKIFEKNN